MIKMKNIHKKYGKNVLLENVTIDLPDTGIYLVKGNNGAGKTTLFHILCNFVRYKGKVKNPYLNQISYLYQNPYLLEYFTIREHFELFDIPIDKLDSVGLLDKLDEYPKALSSGEKQRIGIVLSVCSKRQLVLLDEPFANLDKNNIDRIFSLLKNEKEKKLILIISHKKQCFDYDGYINIKNKHIKVKSNKNIYKNNCSVNKNVFKFKFFKKYIRYCRMNYFKLYLFTIIIFLALGGFIALKESFKNTVYFDIDHSLDYNKFYLKECEDILQSGLTISKCKNPSEELLTNDYKYNYDYLLNYLYNRDDLSVINNEGIDLKKGRYPREVNEVIASSRYKIGDYITLEGNLLYKDKKTNIYHDLLEVEVVGVYDDLYFYKYDKIYFLYEYVDYYIKNEKFNNSEMTLYEYYKNIDIDVFKYVSFDRKEQSGIVYVGEKYDYYTGVILVFENINILLEKFIVLILIFSLFNFIRYYHLFLQQEEKNISFLLANSFDKKKLFLGIIISSNFVNIMMFIIVLLFSLLIHKLIYLLLLSMFIFVFSSIYIFVFFRKDKIGSKIRSNI